MAADIIRALIARARAAQHIAAGYDQARLDDLVAAAGWAIMEPQRNRALAELAVRDTGLGNVEDKIDKNHRKTLGLLRDLKGAISTGVIAAYPDQGIVEIAKPVGVVAAVVPSTNPGATPANNVINALKCGNAIILSPSPKGYSTSAKLLEYLSVELERVGAPRDLVQILPAPVTKALSSELMKQADLVVVTGSQANVRAAYSSGTPALGVGAGNVAVIVDETADLADAARKIATSKTFDNATSCSSENSVIVVEENASRLLDAFATHGGVLLDASEKHALERAMFADGKLLPEVIAQSAGAIAKRAGIDRAAGARFLIVDETGVGGGFPFSGEKLSPVLALYRA